MRVTDLRNPRRQLNDITLGLIEAVLGRDSARGLILRCKIMAVVIAGGELRASERVVVERAKREWAGVEVGP